MASIRARLLNAYIKRTIRPLPMTDMDIGVLRKILETRPVEGLPRDVAIDRVNASDFAGVARDKNEPAQADGEQAERTPHDVPSSDEMASYWAKPANDEGRRVILYLHGGGYAFGTPLSYRAVTTRLAKFARAPVFTAGYRRAPEHACPAAIDDALAAWTWLTGDRAEGGLGHDPQTIFVGGDSAGGGLTLALVQALIRQGRGVPGGLFLFSPWTDLAATGASVGENAERDVIFQETHLRRAGPRYAGDLALNDPRVSPLYGDMTGLPPMTVFVSDDEMLRDDSLRLAEKARAAGVRVDLERRQSLVHAWPIFPPFLPEASRTLKDTAAFIRREVHG